MNENNIWDQQFLSEPDYNDTTLSLLDDLNHWPANAWPEFDNLVNYGDPPSNNEGSKSGQSPFSSPADVSSPTAGSSSSIDRIWTNDDLATLSLDEVLDTLESEDSAISRSRSSSSSGGTSTGYDDILSKLLRDNGSVVTEEKSADVPALHQRISTSSKPNASSCVASRFASGSVPTIAPATVLPVVYSSTPACVSNGVQVTTKGFVQGMVLSPTYAHAPTTPVTLLQTTSPTAVTYPQTSLVSAANSQILLVHAGSSNGQIANSAHGRTDVHAPLRRCSTGEKANPRRGPYLPIRPRQKQNGATTSVVGGIETQHAVMPPTPVIKLSPVPQPAIIFSQAIKQSPPHIMESIPTPPTPDVAVDEKVGHDEASALKRQCRMLRNREAAYLSRKRKKEFVDTLQEKVNELTLENDKLKRENVALRDSVASLKIENERLKGAETPSLDTGRSTWQNGKRTTVCILAVLLLLSVNIGSYWNAYYPQQLQPIAPDRLGLLDEPLVADNYVVGRRLLSTSNGSDNAMLAESPENASGRNLSRTRRNATNGAFAGATNVTSHVPTCPINFNRTESLRLADELNSWARRHESARSNRYKLKLDSAKPPLWTESDEQEIAAFWAGNDKESKAARNRYRLSSGLSSKGEPILDENADIGPFPSKSAGFEYRQIATPTKQHRQQRKSGRGGSSRGAERALERKKASNNKQWSVHIYEGNELKYVKFLEALHRRDDTFYVISFLRDYLLLPANSFNKTARPRMSLVMPALPLNESMQPPPHHVAMMQIECEVTGTSLLHLPEALIPSFLLQNRTSSTESNEKKDWTEPMSDANRNSTASGTEKRRVQND